ncbi:uncharacterized mitochondrial protein AtMg00810-like [Lathyrus oleraceus]|uniref:uncharacterized mitochondrial protein AtMg00810-like n=1 Tax=Pisum sativum TaxID=3888 RepID=UPI0021D33427|nr:uncharacterized mitochondrial protein AtMg00810-like [Pisum sativum]
MAYILLYVDGIILAGSSHDLCKHIMTLLSSEFSMKDLGPLSYLLGIAMTIHVNGLFLSKSTYASDIIARVDMASCKPYVTPIDTKHNLSTYVVTPYDDHTLYQSLVGALQYLTFTCPGISCIVQQEKVARGQPRILYAPSWHQIAGIFTKGLHRVFFDDLWNSLSVYQPPILIAGV